MLQIYIPDNNISERTYCIQTVIGEFLGLPYTLHSGEYVDYTIKLPNSKKIIIKDHFFNLFPKDFDYFKKENLPDEITYGNYFFLPEQDIPILYGGKDVSMDTLSITLDADIFASTFLMLTRWEEYVNSAKDAHDRFPAQESIASKFNFLSRPIVNEYVELLWAIFYHLDPEMQRKARSYRLFVSCDVDFPYDPAHRSFYRTLRRTAYRCMKSNLREHHFPLLNYFVGKTKPDYDLYTLRLNWLMTLNERFGNIVAFNFIPLLTDAAFEYNFQLSEEKVKKVILQIASRGHELGFHPGYQTYKDENLFFRSLTHYQTFLTENGLNNQIKGGRQHFLRWSFPETLSLWDESGLSYDSTLGYPDDPGFRCGTCYEFPLFNVLERKTLTLRERPLILMECSVIDARYLGLGRTEEARRKMLELKQTCKKYSGDFSLLWHNSAFHTKFDEDVYRELIG